VFSSYCSFCLGQVVFHKELIPAKGAFFNRGCEKCGLAMCGLNGHPQAWTPLFWSPALEATTHSLLILLGHFLTVAKTARPNPKKYSGKYWLITYYLLQVSCGIFAAG
jgi:hypothetical protein